MTAHKVEKVLPYNNSDQNKSAQVELMFDSIAENYDTLNHTLSIGIDKGWRKKGILELKSNHPQNILDIATGTGDLAIAACDLLNPKSIIGIDISEKMMIVGAEKVKKAGLTDKISFSKQDSEALKFSDNTFDAAIVAFGIRNFENLDTGLSEICRVLKPSAQLLILELATPQKFPMKQGYWLYSKIFIPTGGRIISKDQSAYSYLPKSIEAFPHGQKMIDTLKESGFKQVKYKTYTFGICAMYLATK